MCIFILIFGLYYFSYYLPYFQLPIQPSNHANRQDFLYVALELLYRIDEVTYLFRLTEQVKLTKASICHILTYLGMIS